MTAKPAAPTPVADIAVAAPAPDASPGLVVSSPRGPKPTYRIGDTMAVSVQPTRHAYVYCYYQDATGNVARIFPNRFQADPFLRAGQQIEVPPAGQKSFAIRFDKPGGFETIACLGANQEVGLRLPDKLKAQDLEPLPVSGLDEIATQFRGVPGVKIGDARLTVQVIQ